MEKPVISIIASAIRVEHWQEYHQSLINTNSVPFEIVFVGDRKPTYSLPENFKYIYSPVKPTQCMEIAARAASGKYICDSSDDLSFSNNYYDILFEKMEKINDENIVLLPMIATRWRVKAGAMHIKKKDSSSPNIGMVTFIRKDMWHKLGGLSREFISTWHNHDLKLRLVERGGECIPVRECVCNEEDMNSTLRHISGKIDQNYLYSCWYRKSKFSNKRVLPATSLSTV